MSQDAPQEGQARRAIPEWATLVVSLGIVALLLALIGYTYVAGSEAPPQVEVRRQDGMYELPVEVVNRGGQAAADVWVRLAPEATGPWGAPVLVRIDVLPPGGMVGATAVLPYDPRGRGVIAAAMYRGP